jgi:hypothetical protein
MGPLLTTLLLGAVVLIVFGMKIAMIGIIWQTNRDLFRRWRSDFRRPPKRRDGGDG